MPLTFFPVDTKVALAREISMVVGLVRRRMAGTVHGRCQHGGHGLGGEDCSVMCRVRYQEKCLCLAGWCTTSNPGNNIAPQAPQLSASNDRWSRLRGLRRRLAPAQSNAQSEALARQPVSEVSASASDASVTAMSPASDVTGDAPGPDLAGTSPAPDTHVIASAPAE